MKFALFFLAEYINMVTVRALATTLFLGGWRAPVPLSLWHGANPAGGHPLVHRQGRAHHLRVRVAARHAAPHALRPVHALRLEGAHPDQPGVDPLRRHHARARRPRLGALAGRRRRPGAGADRVDPGGAGAGPQRQGPAVRARPDRERGTEARRRRSRRPRWTSSSRPRRACWPPRSPREAGPALSRAEMDPRHEWSRNVDNHREPSAVSPRASASPSRRCSRRSTPSSTRSTCTRPLRATTAVTCSTVTLTAWRSASAASCARGPARRTRSTSRAATTPRRRGSPR